MENRHFDHLTKIVAEWGTRRAVLRLLAASAASLVLGRRGREETLADDRDASCRGSCDTCDRDGKCCSGRCERGVCKCKRRGSCAHDRACCSGRCRDGRCKRAPDPGCDDRPPRPDPYDPYSRSR